MTAKGWIVPAAVTAILTLSCSGGGGKGSTPTAPGGGVGGNHAPTVNLNVDKTVLGYGQTATLTAAPSDADGDQLTLAWKAGRGTVQSSGPTATTATYTAPNSWGADSATVTVSDGKGGTAAATADTYVRNPNPPAFTLAAVGSASCGYGTPIPDGFVLSITSGEDVLVTDIIVHPSFCTSSSCTESRHYATPLVLRAGVAYDWTDVCLTTTCCTTYSCGTCGHWDVIILGARPSPDGGGYSYECPSWTGGAACN